MLKRIVMQLSGRGMALCTRLWVWLKARLWNLANNLLVRITQISQSVLTPLHPLATTLSSFKAWRANPTTQVLSIKLVLKRAVTISGQIGLRLATTARQTLQRVKPSRKKGK